MGVNCFEAHSPHISVSLNHVSQNTEEEYKGSMMYLSYFAPMSKDRIQTQEGSTGNYRHNDEV